MAFRQGFLLGAAAGALVTLLYTPLEGRDVRAILLGPLGWREVESEPDVDWTPTPTEPRPEDLAPATAP
ncbi:MAG TPA: YtxH domain-containing protein [Chloroflexota bacterium]